MCFEGSGISYDSVSVNIPLFNPQNLIVVVIAWILWLRVFFFFLSELWLRAYYHQLISSIPPLHKENYKLRNEFLVNVFLKHFILSSINVTKWLKQINYIKIDKIQIENIDKQAH